VTTFHTLWRMFVKPNEPIKFRVTNEINYSHINSTYLFSLYIMMCINFPINVRLLEDNERGFPLIFTITLIESHTFSITRSNAVWRVSYSLLGRIFYVDFQCGLLNLLHQDLGLTEGVITFRGFMKLMLVIFACSCTFKQRSSLSDTIIKRHFRHRTNEFDKNKLPISERLFSNGRFTTFLSYVQTLYTVQCRYDTRKRLHEWRDPSCVF
jgi:hypothetical protein